MIGRAGVHLLHQGKGKIKEEKQKGKQRKAEKQCEDLTGLINYQS